MFLFSSMMLSSIVSVVVLNVVCVPSTVKFPFTLTSPHDGSSSNPVDPSMVIIVVVTPPSFTVKIISLSCVVCAMVRLSLDRLIVMSDPAPKINPVSFAIVNELFVESFWSDLR